MGLLPESTAGKGEDEQTRRRLLSSCPNVGHLAGIMAACRALGDEARTPATQCAVAVVTFCNHRPQGFSAAISGMSSTPSSYGPRHYTLATQAEARMDTALVGKVADISEDPVTLHVLQTGAVPPETTPNEQKWAVQRSSHYRLQGQELYNLGIDGKHA